MYLWQSPFIFMKKTLDSLEPPAEGIKFQFKRSMISLQYSFNSFSIPCLYSLNKDNLLEFLASSFYSIEERALQAVLLLPTVFLYATERRFLSSMVKSFPSFTTFFMWLNMSSNLSVYSVILAIKMYSSLESDGLLILFKYIII